MLIDKRIFFDQYRLLMDGDQRLEQSLVNSIDLFLNMAGFDSAQPPVVAQGAGYFSVAQWAYVFATVFHETAATMAPVREAFRQSEEWRRLNLSYWPHYGRGYVQITHKDNYERMAAVVKRDLKIVIQHRDDFMLPRVAFYVLVYGFKHGSYTGKAISDYIPDNTVKSERVHFENVATQLMKPTETLLYKYFKDARRCINGTDRADMIAGYALRFLEILNKSIIK
jgi:hypothetical protein